MAKLKIDAKIFTEDVVDGDSGWLSGKKKYKERDAEIEVCTGKKGGFAIKDSAGNWITIDQDNLDTINKLTKK